MSKLSFKSVSLYQNQNTHFAIFIQGDINKQTLYMYCCSKLFKKYFAKYQFCNVVNQIREGVKLFRKYNSEFLISFERYYVTTPPCLRIYPLNMIIFLHINTPWIKLCCFTCSNPCSTNLVILVKATICQYYMCKV